MGKGRRSELDIISNILEMSKEGSNKTKILLEGNLSYSQLQSYLPFLIQINVLEEKLVKDDNKTYRYYMTTGKGLDLLHSAKKTLQYLR